MHLSSEKPVSKLAFKWVNLHRYVEVLTDPKRRREYDSVDAPATDLPEDFGPEVGRAVHV